jgi:hypothetical protein
MKRVEGLRESLLSLSKSSTDSNRLYSILLDARVSAEAENIHDTVERLLDSEKENAKSALEHLWELKKNLHSAGEATTLDLLIQFYQNKIDVLRGREEHIRKINKDSRELLEEKRKRDAEIASIKQQISEGTREITDLTEKIDRLKIKEQELILIETQVRKELSVNENEVINGLYEIIMPMEREDDGRGAEAAEAPAGEEAAPVREEVRPKPEGKLISGATELDLESLLSKKPEVKQEEIVELDSIKEKEVSTAEIATELYKRAELQEKPPLPKSVVKTTGGKVIGEYYYDPNAYKNRRHYIFNSRFFAEQLRIAVNLLEENTDQAAYTGMLQMIQDAYKRLTENGNIHYENATNEILNEKSLREVWQLARAKSYKDLKPFCARIKAKLEMLGTNYSPMLREQMQRYFET